MNKTNVVVFMTRNCLIVILVGFFLAGCTLNPPSIRDAPKEIMPWQITPTQSGGFLSIVTAQPTVIGGGRGYILFDYADRTRGMYDVETGEITDWPAGADLSPKRRQMVYARGSGVYLANIDSGKEVELVSHERGEIVGLSWSPDGEKLVYGLDIFGAARVGQNVAEYYLLELGQTEPILLPSLFKGGVWGPYGDRIAHPYNENGVSKVGVLLLSSLETVELTKFDLLFNFDISWSLNGRYLVYSVYHSDKFFNKFLTVVNLEGFEEGRIIESKDVIEVRDFDLSPDGEKIVVSYYYEGGRNTFQIYISNLDGSNLTRLTNNGLNNYFEKWSPDGTKIMFVSSNLGEGFAHEIWVMDADGANLTKLITAMEGTTTLKGGFPAWAPDSKAVVVATAEGFVILGLDGSVIRDVQVEGTRRDDGEYTDYLSWQP